jgi:valyl-tRNA synthetase
MPIRVRRGVPRATGVRGASAIICRFARPGRVERRPHGTREDFEPHAIEAKWYPVWESRGYFKPSYAPGAPPFCIQVPPPNVTGTLHMGHAFQLTLMDVLIRWHRMRGDNTLWQLGTDHAGIATQIVVENQLRAEGRRATISARAVHRARRGSWKQESGSRSPTDASSRPFGRPGRANASRRTKGLSRAVVETLSGSR